MVSVVEELDSALLAMQTLKPPGVSGSKISSITALCEKNVQSESVIIQKIFTHFKKTAGTHKLGVLYVVDSVTRKWLDHAKKAGQTIDGSAVDGSYAAGVNRISELLPILMNDIIQHAPADQKEKIRKLIVIWERGSTFPASLLSSFQTKLNAATQNASTTPPGSPPTKTDTPLATKQSNAQTASEASSILQSLANIARQSKTAATAVSGVPALDHANNISSMQNAFQSIDTPVNLGTRLPTASQRVDMPTSGAGNVAPVFPGVNLNNLPAPQFLAQTQGHVPNNTLGAALPSANIAGNEGLHEQMMILQVFANQGLPPDQWAEALNLVLASGANTNGSGDTGKTTVPSWPQNGDHTSNGEWNRVHDYQSRDHRGTRNDPVHSPPHRRRETGRSRSRSPRNRKMNGDQSPAHLRKSPDYGDSPSRRRGDEDDRRGRNSGRGQDNSYRERSPVPHRRQSSSPLESFNSHRGSAKAKWVDHDPSIGPDRIKVLSRTLFVGGVTCTESELRSIFLRFGKVQTCIVNMDKRHGFVKMISREDALRAKDGMENYSDSEMQLRVRSTRWGVGFGPRDCSDYQTGVSIIPIDRLTDADRKWMLTAENGGSGGKPIVAGMVVEEPDIEIGQGVSSKAISKRVATDHAGNQGQKSTRGGGGRIRHTDHDVDSGPPDSVNGISGPPLIPPPIPGFAFPSFPNGMPMFPPGFPMPGLPQPPQQ